MHGNCTATSITSLVPCHIGYGANDVLSKQLREHKHLSFVHPLFIQWALYDWLHMGHMAAVQPPALQVDNNTTIPITTKVNDIS
jgi:hypothetical protein